MLAETRQRENCGTSLFDHLSLKGLAFSFSSNTPTFISMEKKTSWVHKIEYSSHSSFFLQKMLVLGGSRVLEGFRLKTDFARVSHRVSQRFDSTIRMTLPLSHSLSLSSPNTHRRSSIQHNNNNKPLAKGTINPKRILVATRHRTCHGRSSSSLNAADAHPYSIVTTAFDACLYRERFVSCYLLRVAEA